MATPLEPLEAVAARLTALIQPGVRGRLFSRGLARGMIWKNGVLPEGAPGFSPSLSADLLDHGYAILAQALNLRGLDEFHGISREALRFAAEAIESAVRKGDAADELRQLHLLVAASAFHLGGFAARSYCLLPNSEAAAEWPVGYRALSGLMRRSLRDTQELIIRWLADEANSDDSMATRLLEDEAFGPDDAMAVALARNLLRGLGAFLSALQSGSPEVMSEARGVLRKGYLAAGEAGHVSAWWSHVLAWHLIQDLWDHSLHTQLPATIEGPDAEAWASLRKRFIAHLTARSMAEVDLWPSQLEAAKRCVDPTDDLVVALPTSAGKTRIAELCMLRALAAGRRVVYVTPLRALSAQLERKLGKTFRPLGYSVSALYGASGVAVADVGTLKESQVVVATPEKLDFAIRQEPSVLDDVALVVLDEGHMIGLGTREVRYEVLVQSLLRREDALNRRIVCLSAVFSTGDAFDDFTEWLRADVPGSPVESAWRPTRQRTGVLQWMGDRGRLSWSVDGETPYLSAFVTLEPPTPPRRKAFPNNDAELVISAAKALHADGHRVLIYCPQRRSVEALAKEFTKAHRQRFLRGLLPADADLQRALRVGREWLGEDHIALKALALGIGIHHGALPRPFLAEIEALLHDRVLPIAIASPTLAQGLDLSCSALIFRSLYRSRQRISAAEYANVVGRAGRAYVDIDGLAILPIFESGWIRRQRLAEFAELQEEARSRSMESGILLLIDGLIQAMLQRVGGTSEALTEYVLNYSGDWGTGGTRSGSDQTNPSQGTETGDTEDGVDPIPSYLHDLDTAILGTISELGAPIEQVAQLLDAALESSLWRRRLQARSEATQQLQKAVMAGRATWIWRKTDEPQRRSFFASGLGYHAGSVINASAATLVPLLLEAEGALESGAIEAAAQATVSIARTLFTVHPFSVKDLPPEWPTLLRAWLAGDPLGAALTASSANEVAFIQDSVVYRLVWGVEAIRVQAIVAGLAAALEIGGSLALCLTYGAPSVQAALLLGAGLPSREMAVEIVRTYRPTYSNVEGMAEWLREVAVRPVHGSVWPESSSNRLWVEFVQRWGHGDGFRWEFTNIIREVNWRTTAAAPAPGATVQLRHDDDAGVTRVYDQSLELCGVLREPFAAATFGNTNATVHEQGARISIEYFGPRI